MLVLDAFKGCLTPEIKATISAIHMNLVIIPADDIPTADVRCCGEQQAKAVVWQVALGRGPCFTPSGRIKKPNMTSLLVDHYGMTVNLTRSDSEKL